MTETPVSVVKSGKTYRQLFDAEVQLMKSLGANRIKLKTPKVLPEIRSNLERSGTGLTAQSILTTRQTHWKDGTYNDFLTENPVDYMQQEAEMGLRDVERSKRKEESEVRGLPEVVRNDEDERGTENIIQKIEASCRQRYDAHIVEMYTEMSKVRTTINPQVAQVGISLKNSLEKIDEKVHHIFDELSLDENIFGKTMEDLHKLWNEIEELFSSKAEMIEKFHVNFNELEDQRLTLISGMLNKFADILKGIAAIPVSETRRLMEKESMLLNQTSLANKRAFGELKRNLREKIIKDEMDRRRQYEQRIADWKLMSRDHIIKTFKDFMKKDDVKNPREVAKLHGEFLEEQRQLISLRSSVLNQLTAFQPPVSTKPSVYKWNSTLTKTQQKLENLHKRWIEHLQMTYENICQHCLEKVEKAKVELLEVTDDSVRIVNEEFLTRVGNQLKIFEFQLHKMERDFEYSSRHNEKELRKLFKFAQSTAHLWDVHEINMARREKEIETELEQGRLVYDKTNEERESRLDVLLDRLRQENSVDSLNQCQQLCFHLLSEIKTSYHGFCDEQSDQMDALLLLVNDEVDRYESAICKFFSVAKREDPVTDDDGDGQQAAPEGSPPDDELTEEMAHVVERMLTTNGGVTYLLTSDDVVDNDSDGEGDDVNADTGSADPVTSAAEYMEDVVISPEMLQELKKNIRYSFLQHLDHLRAKCLEASQEKVNYKKEELRCELELRLHLHEPRSQRIQRDIRNVREVELKAHEDRIVRHCKGVISALATIKSQQFSFVEYENEKIAKFKTEMAAMEAKISKLNITTRIEQKMKEAEGKEVKLVEMLRKEGKRIKEKIQEKFGALKQSNKMCLASFRLFSDGGNFSPDEVALLRQQMEQAVQKVDGFELGFRNEFDSGMEKKCEQIRDVRNKFNERMKFQLADVKFLELLRSWFLSAQIGIKGEVALSDRMASQLSDDVTLLLERIDACEYAHVDKEEVDEEALWRFSEEVIGKIDARCRYLDCRRRLHRRVSDCRDNVTNATEEESREEKTDGDVSSSDPISVIRSIFQKQNAAKETAPSSVATPVRKIYRESEAGRKSDQKLDSRFFPFGYEVPRQPHFLAKISAVLFGVLENLYSICDDYYKHKSFRPTTRPSFIQDNFDACCESVLEKTLKFYDQCQAHYDLALSEFRALLERSEIIFQNVPRLWINKMAEKFTENFNQKLDQIEDNFRKTQTLHQQEKDDNESQLEPRLGHPQMREKFRKLEEREKDREERQRSLIEQTHEDSNKLIEESSVEFAEMLATSSIKFLRQFQRLICIDDVIIPDTTPEVRFSMDTLLKKRCKCGLELEQLSVPTSHASISSLQRGATKWPSLKIPKEICKIGGKKMKRLQVETETTNAVKPQQQIVQSRDLVFHHFLQSRVDAMKQNGRRRDERIKKEERWVENWGKSMQNIYHFYN